MLAVYQLCYTNLVHTRCIFPYIVLTVYKAAKLIIFAAVDFFPVTSGKIKGGNLFPLRVRSDQIVIHLDNLTV